MDALTDDTPLVQGVRVGVELQRPEGLGQSLELELRVRHGLQLDDLLTSFASLFGQTILQVKFLFTNDVIMNTFNTVFKWGRQTIARVFNWQLAFRFRIFLSSFAIMVLGTFCSRQTYNLWFFRG